MAFTSYSDIYDPEVLKTLIGEKWLNEIKVMPTGIVKRAALPGQGSLTTNIRQKIFQGTSRQAIAGGDEISSQAKEQNAVNAPILWGYNAVEIPDAIAEIAVSQIPSENADMASSIQIAAMQYVDDSVIAAIEGASGALTDNNIADTGATITVANLVALKQKSGDKLSSLDSGAFVCHNVVYYDLLAAGAVAATANTFGIQLQEGMVRDGVLPTNIMGLTPIVTDKVTSTTGTADYRSYMIGAGVLELQGGGAPQIEVSRLPKSFSTFTKFKIKYGIGVFGVTWGVSGKEDVTDTELIDASNWTLSTNTNSNDVAIYRIITD